MSANFLRKSFYAATLLALSGAVAFSPSLQPAAMAQTNISGDIAGVVTDPSGAAIPGATVTVTSKAKGSTKTAMTDARGAYRVPLLSPGDYAVVIAANGFEGQHTTVTVAAGQVASGDSKLTVGKSSQTVDVTASAALLNTEDAQISTSFSMEQIQSLPNPGNDLTFVAQTSPGAVMNTQGGYGNFSVFGLPATSNTFTVNGGYQNDPFLNLNNSGATNLLLGNNDIADVTVTSNAYDAAFGGLGGAQINEISRSGGNAFHGNANYWWNGRTMNANDYFNNEAGTPRPFDNVNQYDAAIGGPIKKDKIFFFGNYEGLRVVLPTRSTVYAPTVALQNAILGTGSEAAFPNELPFGNLIDNGNASEVALYQNIFAAFNNAPGIGSAQVLPAGNDPSMAFTGFRDANAFESFNGTAGNFTHEWLATGRVDFNLGQNDKLFIHGKVDKGLQATFTSLLNPIYNADSPQPEYNGELQETHTFGPNLTNQFLFAAEYYRAIFTNTSLAAANALTPFTLIFGDSALGGNPNGGLVGGLDIIWPQGRNVTNYQFADDLSWTKGNHSIKVGWSIRRDDVSDFDPQEFTTPEDVALEESFGAGYLDEYVQNFPARGSQPIALYNMGAYVQDQWKALPNLTVTYGIRFEHNSNPTCLTNCFGYSNGDFSTLSTDTTTPLNQLLAYNQHRAFIDLEKIGYEPRFGFAYLPMGAGTKTVIRGGFGMFVDTFPATVADALLNNAPLNIPVQFVDAYFGGPLAPPQGPGFPGAITLNGAPVMAAADAAATTAGFASGASTSSLGFEPGLVTQAPKIKYPTYEEYNLELQQQVSRATAVDVQYVGNHGYHEPVVSNSANSCGFGPLPGCSAVGSGGLNPNFTGTTIDYAGSSSNYNGLIASVINRQRWLTLQFNYAWSHALDEISNGGFLSFGLNSSSPTSPTNLNYDYGNADYDTRNYISGSYVITVPHFGGPKVLVDNWEIAGTVFHNTGYPFSVVDGATSETIPYYGGALYANQVGTSFSTKCGGESHAFNPLLPAQNPCTFGAAGGSNLGLANYASASTFGQQERNQLRGPNFTDADIDITKGFKIPHWESANLKVGAQFFNVFNHPNFQLPASNTLDLGSDFGTSTSLQGTPTSILGAFLGGDSSPRLIQLKGVFTF
jgi:hypothetical protein